VDIRVAHVPLHLGTGLWLRHLVFAVVLNFVLKYTLPL
jgi:hypothetical protein